MPWRWPYERRGEAATQGAVVPRDATEGWIESLYRETDRAVVWETAIAEAAAGLWGRALASAAVSPMAPALAGVSPAFLAWAGRALILRGEAIAVIEIADNRAILLPALAYDIDGAADPAAWTYRLDIAGPSTHRSRRVPGAGVVHFKWAVRATRPWRGLSPIREARATGALHARLTAMASHLEDPTYATAHVSYPNLEGREAPTGDQMREVSKTIGEIFAKRRAHGGRVITLGPGAEMKAPRRDAPQDAEEELFEASAGQILAACGIPPQLLSSSGEATIAREAWRLFYLSAVAPVARMVEAELRDKLHPAAMLEFGALRASDRDQARPRDHAQGASLCSPSQGGAGGCGGHGAASGAGGRSGMMREPWAIAEAMKCAADPWLITPAVKARWRDFPRIMAEWRERLAGFMPDRVPAAPIRPERPCAKCGNRFKPTAKRTRLCEGCFREADR